MFSTIRVLGLLVRLGPPTQLILNGNYIQVLIHAREMIRAIGRLKPIFSIVTSFRNIPT